MSEIKLEGDQIKIRGFNSIECGKLPTIETGIPDPNTTYINMDIVKPVEDQTTMTRAAKIQREADELEEKFENGVSEGCFNIFTSENGEKFSQPYDVRYIEEREDGKKVYHYIQKEIDYDSPMRNGISVLYEDTDGEFHYNSYIVNESGLVREANYVTMKKGEDGKLHLIMVRNEKYNLSSGGFSIDPEPLSVEDYKWFSTVYEFYCKDKRNWLKREKMEK